MITLNTYIKHLQGIVRNDPEFGKLPVVYSHDDEGNAYQKIHNQPNVMIVEDINQHYLEPRLIGKGETVDKTDINCIIVN